MSMYHDKKSWGGKIKSYCEKCGTLLYELIVSKKNVIEYNGEPVPNYDITVYNRYVHLLGWDYCERCYSKR